MSRGSMWEPTRLPQELMPGQEEHLFCGTLFSHKQMLEPERGLCTSPKKRPRGPPEKKPRKSSSIWVFSEMLMLLSTLRSFFLY